MDTIIDQIKKFKESIIDKPKPNHIAININGNVIWSERNKKDLDEAYRLCLTNVRNLVQAQVELDLPILSFLLVSDKMINSEKFLIFMEHLIKFFEKLKDDELIHKSKVKVSVLGKWYDLPFRLVEKIKDVLDATKDYDNFFLNLCVNYNGQEEIVDSCKLLARQILAEKIDPESINKEVIKNNLYSSNFLPPDLIIITGNVKRLSGLLLWDSFNSQVYFSEKLWPEYGKGDLVKAIDTYKK